MIELSGVAVGAGGPLERDGGEKPGHAVVGMGGDEAFGAEGEDDVGAQGADGADDVSGDGGEVLGIESAVVVVEHLAVGNAEVMAGGGELLAADGLEAFVIGGAAAVDGALSGGKTDHGAVDARLGILGQDSAEAAGFIVGMGGDTEQSQHSISSSINCSSGCRSWPAAATGA